MRVRSKKVKWLLYPEDFIKEYWDIFITLVLFASLVITPMRIAFGPISEYMRWKIVEFVIVALFFIDIIVNFNSAYYDDDYVIVENRKLIGREYIKSWFLIDVLAITPLEYFFSANLETEDEESIASIGRASKLSKMIKLLRILKIV